MAKAKKTGTTATSEAKFPYTTKPGSLRRLLKDIPAKPRPGKFDIPLLQSWGFRDANDHSMLRVLRPIGLLNDKNEPTELYLLFMNLGGGAAVLGTEIRRLYAPIFTASHKPYDESAEKLKNIFNIHSGGGERALELQMHTFKALCESASFDAMQPALGTTSAVGTPAGTAATVVAAALASAGQPTVNINLHIHLPENKTRRDYTDIIEDIGRYIFGRVSGEPHD
jgi:hypothetical protein